MKSRLEGIGGALVLIGIGLIFWLDLSFWPWILFVVAVPALLDGLAKGDVRRGAKGALWLIGIGVIALFNWWWPGMLFVIALSILVENLFKSLEDDGKLKRKAKPKRGLPLPEDDDWV